MLRFIPCALTLTVLAPCSFAQPEASAESLVRAALQDYLGALYEAAPERIERSVSPDLVKLGLWHDAENGRWQPSPMTYDRLVKLAGRWNHKGDQVAEGAVGRVTVFEVADDIACGLIEAVWGLDYAQLVRDADGRWRIRQLLWQSWPGAPGAKQPVDAKARAAVEAACFAYLDAFYQVDPERIDRGVHPELAKVGVVHEDGKREERPMTFAALRELSARAFKDRPVPDDAPRTVEILDLRSHTALVRLVGVWGFDYVSLARGPKDRWQIRQVVWQRAPAKPPVRPKRG